MMFNQKEIEKIREDFLFLKIIPNLYYWFFDKKKIRRRNLYFYDEAIIKELNLPPPADLSAALVYQRLPTIAQRRILVRASQELFPSDLSQFNQLLIEEDGLKIQQFLAKKIPDLKSIINQELEKLKKVLESLSC